MGEELEEIIDIKRENLTCQTAVFGNLYVQTFTYINENNYTYEIFPWIMALKDWHATFPEFIQ